MHLKAEFKLFIAISLLVIVSCQSAPEISQEFDVKATITEFGIYNSTRLREKVSPNSISGLIADSANWMLLESTDIVPGILNNKFGYEVLLEGSFPIGTVVDIKTIVRHPEIINPETGKSTTVQSWPFNLSIGIPLHSGYTFDFDYEIVPGTWVLEQWLGDQLLVSKEFTVVLPPTEGSI